MCNRHRPRHHHQRQLRNLHHYQCQLHNLYRLQHQQSLLGHEETDSATVYITITSVNDPPVINPIGNKTINEGQSLTFTISATDPDGDTLTYSASNLPNGASFNPTTGQFSWKPTYNQAGIYKNIRFEVSDGTNNVSQTITINVINVTTGGGGGGEDIPEEELQQM